MISLPSITTQFRALFKSGDSWFDADRVVTSGGNTVSLIDYLDSSHALTQPTSANQPPAPAPDANASGRNTITYGGTRHHDSTRTPADWAFLHNGSLHTAIAVVVPGATNGTVYVTQTGGSSTVGALALGQWATPQLSYRIGNGSSTVAGPNGTISVTPPSARTAQFRVTGAGAWQLMYDGAAVASASGAPLAWSSADPGRTLRVGQNHALTFPLSGAVRALYFWRRDLTPSERNIISAYIRADCGAAA